MYNTLYGVNINDLLEIIRMSDREGYENGDSLKYVQDLADKVKRLEKTLSIENKQN